MKRLAMLVALAVFQLPMLQLKLDADWNAPAMVSTRAVLQLARSWLKAVAPLKRLAMLVALAVFQLPML